MKTVRNVSALVFLLCIGISVPSAATTPARRDCSGSPPSPHCADINIVECTEWPGACYLQDTQEDVGESEAEEVCELYAGLCEISADVEPEGACWWKCQFETPLRREQD